MPPKKRSKHAPKSAPKLKKSNTATSEEIVPINLPSTTTINNKHGHGPAMISRSPKRKRGRSNSNLSHDEHYSKRRPPPQISSSTFYQNASSSTMASTSDIPTVDQFADALSSEPHWYNLGIFLQLPTAELKKLELEYRSMGTQRCLIELYNSLESLNKVPSWEFLSQALGRCNNVALAKEIYTKYVLRPAQKPS